MTTSDKELTPSPRASPNNPSRDAERPKKRHLVVAENDESSKEDRYAGLADTAGAGVMSELRASMTCAICFGLKVGPHTLSCGHTFCGGCLSEWLAVEIQQMSGMNTGDVVAQDIIDAFKTVLIGAEQGNKMSLEMLKFYFDQAHAHNSAVRRST